MKPTRQFLSYFLKKNSAAYKNVKKAISALLEVFLSKKLLFLLFNILMLLFRYAVFYAAEFFLKKKKKKMD